MARTDTEDRTALSTAARCGRTGESLAPWKTEVRRAEAFFDEARAVAASCFARNFEAKVVAILWIKGR
jgi:hypothetical protein